MPLAQLDPKVPQAIDLLGMSLVVWQDSKGTWHAMRDRCPHRWGQGIRRGGLHGHPVAAAWKSGGHPLGIKGR